MSQGTSTIGIETNDATSQLYLDKSDLIFVPTKIMCCITQNTSLFHKFIVLCFSAYKKLNRSHMWANLSPFIKLTQISNNKLKIKKKIIKIRKIQN